MTHPKPAIAVHGGAGALTEIDDDARRRFGRGLRTAVDAAAGVLDRDGAAVEAAVEGEFFCRRAFACRCADLLELGGRNPDSAAREALDEVAALGGRGGAIVLGTEGPARWPFTAGGMLRAGKLGGGAVRWAID